MDLLAEQRPAQDLARLVGEPLLDDRGVHNANQGRSSVLSTERAVTEGRHNRRAGASSVATSIAVKSEDKEIPPSAPTRTTAAPKKLRLRSGVERLGRSSGVDFPDSTLSGPLGWQKGNLNWVTDTGHLEYASLD